MVLPTVILTLVVVGLAVAGLGVRLIFVKDAEFRGTCGTNNPLLTNAIGECTVCGKKPNEECKNQESEAGKN